MYPLAEKAVFDFAALSCVLYFGGPVAVPAACIELVGNKVRPVCLL